MLRDIQSSFVGITTPSAGMIYYQVQNRAELFVIINHLGLILYNLPNWFILCYFVLFTLCY
jgi:hypothetical protein